MNTSFELPWPPSVNHYWIYRATGKRVMVCLGANGKQFRESVRTHLKNEVPFEEQRLVMSIFAYPPDRRKRDLDNILKSTLDAIQHAGIYKDDNQIDCLTITRQPVVPQGKILVRIKSVN
jgi:crossover junction endodeoxyribonuclease RusA